MGLRLHLSLEGGFTLQYRCVFVRVVSAEVEAIRRDRAVLSSRKLSLRGRDAFRLMGKLKGCEKDRGLRELIERH